MSLPFPGWNVVFGETPTAAKWSELGSNDDGLAAGTGLNTNAVTADKLATNAITLGYAQITSNFVLSSSQTVPTQVTGLFAAVTIPAGGRKIKIKGYCGSMTIAGGVGVLTLWDGTVNSGTLLNQANQASSTSSTIVEAVVTPSAGSKTYNVGISNSGANNTTIGAAAGQPAFIEVKVE